jgi:hypothetical protein
MTTLSMSKIRAAVVVASLAVASGTTALHAQDETRRIPVNIPFAFEVASAHLSPGTYVLGDPLQHVLTVRGKSGTVLAIDWREADLAPATEGKVVFDRYGDRYFLREVWVEGKSEHFRCPESKAEHQVRKIYQAANRASIATPTSVEIALLENPR